MGLIWHCFSQHQLTSIHFPWYYWVIYSELLYTKANLVFCSSDWRTEKGFFRKSLICCGGSRHACWNYCNANQCRILYLPWRTERNGCMPWDLKSCSWKWAWLDVAKRRVWVCAVSIIQSNYMYFHYKIYYLVMLISESMIRSRNAWSQALHTKFTRIRHVCC